MVILTRDDQVLLQGTFTPSVHAHVGRTQGTAHRLQLRCAPLPLVSLVVKWRLVSQTLIRKCNSNSLPDELESDKHFYYDERVIDIQDNLSKYLQGVDGPLYES
jgi:hypothetical protein